MLQQIPAVMFKTLNILHRSAEDVVATDSYPPYNPTPHIFIHAVIQKPPNYLQTVVSPKHGFLQHIHTLSSHGSACSVTGNSLDDS